MHGTVPQKIGRVIGNLISNPQYISRCLAHNVGKGKTPLDLELPWFSYAAIDFLETFLQPQMSVFEYGSGGSTVFFARRVKRVVSVENNPVWHDRVSQRLSNLSLTNAIVMLHPFNFNNPVGFESSAYLQALSEEHFDVIVVDGTEEWTQVRPICFARAEQRVKPGGIIVVDDSWRYGQVRESHHALRFEVFQSVGPCRPGVTSTDVFFY